MKVDPNLLRELAGMVPEEGWHELCHDAADEIERLRAENTQYLEDAVETAKMLAEQRAEIERLRAALNTARTHLITLEEELHSHEAGRIQLKAIMEIDAALALEQSKPSTVCKVCGLWNCEEHFEQSTDTEAK